RTARWPELQSLVERSIERSPASPADRAPLRLRLGDLHRDRLGDAETARRCYAEAAGEDPRNARAHEALAELAHAAGDEPAFARHAAAAAEALSPHPRAAAWLRR